MTICRRNMLFKHRKHTNIKYCIRCTTYQDFEIKIKKFLTDHYSTQITPAGLREAPGVIYVGWLVAAAITGGLAKKYFGF